MSHSHLSDDRLIEIYFDLDVTATDRAHLQDCDACRARRSNLAETLDDVRRHFIGDAVAAGHSPRSGSRVGGLRGGYARYTNRAIVLKRTAYVSGVAVSGLYRLADKSSSTLTISGRGAPNGRLTFHGNGSVTGRLGGHKLTLKAAAARVVHKRSWRFGLGPIPALREG